jgi:protein O-GlcNAc transferase
MSKKRLSKKNPKKKPQKSLKPQHKNLSVSEALQQAMQHHTAGQLQDAETLYRQILHYQPNHSDALHLLGMIAAQRGDDNTALELIQKAITINHNVPNFYNSLGNVFTHQNLFDKAAEAYQHALSLNPNFAQAHCHLGSALKNQGLIDEAIAHYRCAIGIQPDYVLAHQNLILSLNYAIAADRATIFAEHQRFNTQHANAYTVLSQSHVNNDQPKRLKIGYISADFRKHAVADFIESVLAHHDENQFEIFCYYNHLQHDEVTQRFQHYAHHWRECAKLSNEALIDQIRQDQIDILIDLGGHTADNRILVFARKPAPIQVTYLGYPNTTGLTAIDYRITDHYLDPEEMSLSSEQPVRMPASFFCYHPHDNTPPINSLPALEQGYITFSAFHNASKLNQESFALWAKILHAVPDAKLMIQTKSLKSSSIQKSLQQHFTDLDIAPERLILKASVPYQAYLEAYHQIDIALDSYPFNGGATTCDALWMGIPVLTLVGERSVSRMGLSILTALGLTEVIAYTQEEYVEKAIKLASELKHLQALRAEMRERMQASPLLDGIGFTRHLEAAYQKMWDKLKIEG